LDSLTSKVTRGVAWMISLRFAIRGVGLVSTLILARLLEPADFGIVAMAMVVVAGIELFATFGFDIALIHNQQAGRDEYDTAWTISAIMGLASAIAIALLAYPAAQLYDEPRLVPVFHVIAIASVLEGLKNIGIVEFRKQLQLEKEFLFRITVKVAAFIVTISIAYMYRSYWALVLGIVFSRLMALLLSFGMQPYRPKISFAAFKEIFGFSKWLFLNNLLVYLRVRSPDFIIGKIVGISGLGLYTIAYEISRMPTTELVAPINRVLLPGLAKIAKEPERLASAFRRAASTMVVLSLPAAFGLAATAHLFTPIVLGEKWLGAIPLIQALAVFGGMTAILSPVSTTLLAIGKPSVVTILSACNLAIILPSAYFMTLRYGPVGTANAITVAMMSFLPIYYTVAARLIGLSFRDVLGIFWRPAISTIVMYFAVDLFFGDATATAMKLISAVAAGACTYAVMMILLWTIAGRPKNCGEAYLLEQIRQRVSRTRAQGIA